MTCRESLDCRCHAPECRRRLARYEQYRQLQRMRGESLRLDSTGAVRRLRALCAIGWTSEALAEQVGIDARHLQTLMAGKRRYVYRKTHRAIADVYERLSMTVGPSAITRTRAKRKDWPPPLAWDDERIDDPTAKPNRSGSGFQGDAARVDRRERVWDVVAVMTRDGHSAEQIAARLGLTTRSVVRIRTKLRKEAA